MRLHGGHGENAFRHGTLEEHAYVHVMIQQRLLFSRNIIPAFCPGKLDLVSGVLGAQHRKITHGIADRQQFQA